MLTTCLKSCQTKIEQVKSKDPEQQALTFDHYGSKVDEALIPKQLTISQICFTVLQSSFILLILTDFDHSQ